MVRAASGRCDGTGEAASGLEKMALVSAEFGGRVLAEEAGLGVGDGASRVAKRARQTRRLTESAAINVFLIIFGLRLLNRRVGH